MILKERDCLHSNFLHNHGISSCPNLHYPSVQLVITGDARYFLKRILLNKELLWNLCLSSSSLKEFIKVCKRSKNSLSTKHLQIRGCAQIHHVGLFFQKDLLTN